MAPRTAFFILVIIGSIFLFGFGALAGYGVVKWGEYKQARCLNDVNDAVVLQSEWDGLASLRARCGAVHLNYDHR